ncbi:MAG: hypothetical protein J7L47_10350 [Candidatus Odinarchaeota archaeon]|nr:hypothetical protein [Candidatus Odinarchaeota archaeon]
MGSQILTKKEKKELLEAMGIKEAIEAAGLGKVIEAIEEIFKPKQRR